MRSLSLKSLFVLPALLLFFSQQAYLQTHSVSGQVLSEESEALVGVNVQLKNSGAGTITDIDGKYEVQAATNDTLVFSYVGFSTQEIPVGTQSEINVTLADDAELLSEVVVVGYGTMKKSDVTGSIVSVRGEALTDVKAGNVLEALQGRIAGVDITLDNGRAGGDSLGILVRGKRSLSATNSPLIIVDGVPYGSHIDISPQDIESVEVLKDASSTAIYGSRGANGVILITTKRGLAGRSKVTFSTYYGISEAFQKVPVYDAQGYIQAKIDANRDINNWEAEPNPLNVFPGDELRGYQEGIETDWQDLVSRTGNQQNYHLGFEGGNDRIVYNTSLDYFKEKGVMKADDFDRFTFHLTLDGKVNHFLRVGTSSVISYKQHDGRGPRFTDAILMSPIVEAYDSNGVYIYQPNFANPRKSPLAYLEDEALQSFGRIFSTVYGELEIIEGLKFRTNINADLSFGRYGFMFPKKAPNEGFTVSGVNLDNDYGYLWNNILTYSRQFGNDNMLVMAGHEMQSNRSEFYGIDGQEQQFDQTLWYNLATNKNQVTESQLEEKALVSFFGRVNYTINDKYIFSVSGRYDGASQLSPGNKWDFFPAASAAWRVIDEPFMASGSVFSDLKLRAGFGVTGNASIDPYSTAASLNPNPLYYEFGDPGAEVPAFGYRPVALASRDLKWERTQQINVGLDFGFFNNRLSGSFDVFNANTDRLLLQDQLPPTTGFDNVYVNAGKTQTWGWELYLQSVNLTSRNFKWSTGLSLYGAREEIVELASGLTEDEGNLWFVGHPVDVWYDFHKIGIWQYGEEDDPTFTRVGEIKVEDVDGNGVIDFEDRVIIGTPRPDWSGSIINTFEFMNFDLTVNIFAKMGQTIESDAYSYDPRMYDNMLAVDYWTPLNPTNAYPAYDATRAELPFESTLKYVDGSYIKLRNVTLGYTFPAVMMRNSPFASLRLYASSKNTALLYSELEDGIDPEREGSIEWPLARLWIFGLDASF